MLNMRQIIFFQQMLIIWIISYLFKHFFKGNKNEINKKKWNAQIKDVYHLNGIVITGKPL